MPSDVNDQRIVDLELKIMDVENTVQQLNDVVLQQYRDIERLQRQQEELLKRAEGSPTTNAIPGDSDEVPPHY